MRASDAMAAALTSADIIGHIFAHEADLGFLSRAAPVCRLWHTAALAAAKAMAELSVSCSVGTRGTGRMQLHGPTQICALPPSGELCMCETDRLRVAAPPFAPVDGGTSEAGGGVWPERAPWTVRYPTATYRPTDPAGVCVDGHVLFIADATSDCVVALDLTPPPPTDAHPVGAAPPTERELRVVGSAGGFGDQPGELISPGPIAVDVQRGRVYVAGGNRITAFDYTEAVAKAGVSATTKWPKPTRGVPAGILGGSYLQFKLSFGGPKGKEPRWFKTIAGIALSAGELYACDYGNCRVQVFDAITGCLMRILGRKGRAPGEFDKPCACAVVHGRLLVCERRRRIQLLTPHGRPLQIVRLGGPCWGCAIDESTLGGVDVGDDGDGDVEHQSADDKLPRGGARRVYVAVGGPAPPISLLAWQRACDAPRTFDARSDHAVLYKSEAELGQWPESDSDDDDEFRTCPYGWFGPGSMYGF